MKRNHLILASLLLIAPLAGCSDAQAKLNDSKTVLFSVGKESVTKGQLYSLMNATAGASTAIADANKAICAKEIKVTDDMKTSSQSTLDNYKTMYGDSFTEYLDSAGMNEEDYMNDQLIPSLQAEKLTSKYIEENWKNVKKLYKPVKATILEFTSDDDAKAALSELNDGSASATDAAANHNSSSSGSSEIYTIESSDVDSMVRTVLTSMKPDDGWKEVPASSGGNYYLVHVDDNDADNFKDEATDTLSSIDQVSKDSTTYFFKKYNFHVYDKTIYDALASDYPDYLVQDMNASASPSASADSSN